MRDMRLLEGHRRRRLLLCHCQCRARCLERRRPPVFSSPFVVSSRHLFMLAFPLSKSKSECIYHPIPLVLVPISFSFSISIFTPFPSYFIPLNLSSQLTNQYYITQHYASSSTSTSTSTSPFKVQRSTSVSFPYFVLFTNPNFLISHILVLFL